MDSIIKRKSWIKKTPQLPFFLALSYILKYSVNAKTAYILMFWFGLGFCFNMHVYYMTLNRKSFPSLTNHSDSSTHNNKAFFATSTGLVFMFY